VLGAVSSEQKTLNRSNRNALRAVWLSGFLPSQEWRGGQRYKQSGSGGVVCFSVHTS